MSAHAFATAIDLAPEHIASTGRDVARLASTARSCAAMIARAPGLAPRTPVGDAWAEFIGSWSRELSIIDDELAAVGRAITRAGERWRRTECAISAPERWS
jgi:hypothetical protein